MVVRARGGEGGGFGGGGEEEALELIIEGAVAGDLGRCC